ncbi:hypothetical protein BGZ94_000312 [Podila epigama]|nr:hypothetical protein BGZ94_000312 [Podila epigama]
MALSAVTFLTTRKRKRSAVDFLTFAGFRSCNELRASKEFYDAAIDTKLLHLYSNIRGLRVQFWKELRQEELLVLSGDDTLAKKLLRVKENAEKYKGSKKRPMEQEQEGAEEEEQDEKEGGKEEEEEEKATVAEPSRTVLEAPFDWAMTLMTSMARGGEYVEQKKETRHLAPVFQGLYKLATDCLWYHGEHETGAEWLKDACVALSAVVDLDRGAVGDYFHAEFLERARQECREELPGVEDVDVQEILKPFVAVVAGGGGVREVRAEVLKELVELGSGGGDEEEVLMALLSM